MEVLEKSLDSGLWHACAGGMVQMPRVNSRVFYFPQGHAEHTLSSVDFGSLPSIPSLILCTVAGVRFLADPETDEVYTKLRLIPVGDEHCFDCDDDNGGVLGSDGSEHSEKPTYYAKTLTQSDANNGGGFSVPRYCADTIFPRLDYTADPPVQNLIAKDVQGQTWKFRHIYRGTPRRHLLTSGWSTFVNQKKLVAGDSVVFLRAENGDICVGIRRAKRGVGNFAGFSSFSKEDENKPMHQSGRNGNPIVRPESVVEAAFLAANGQPFEVVYYPCASTPQFFVKASYVSTAMRIQWCSGMRFKMQFETDDSSRISWCMGTVASVQLAEPILWPSSPWRMLQVTWDEPNLLQNIKSVSPWLVETISNAPALNPSPFLHPRKKLRVPNHPDFPLDSQFPFPSFSGNPLGPNGPLSCPFDNVTAGIQGARHAQIGDPLLDLHLIKQFGPLSPSYSRLDPHAKISNSSDENENISCLSSIGNSNYKTEKIMKKPCFVLFGQPIHIEEQLSTDDTVSKAALEQMKGNFAPEEQTILQDFSNVQFLWKPGYNASDLGHCKVFFESEDVNRTIDLSVLGSYKDLYRKLEHMFGIERLDLQSDIFYRDATGACQQIGDESFGEFVKTARRLTIFMK